MRGRSLLSWLLFLAAVGGWAVLARPPAFGGGTTYVVVSGSSMEPTYRTGDLVVARGSSTYRVGDVVAYRATGSPSVVIHRVVAVHGDTLTTKGDNLEVIDPWRPATSDVVGRAVLTLPRGGAALSVLPSGPVVVGALSGAVTAATVIFTPSGGRRRSRPSC